MIEVVIEQLKTEFVGFLGGAIFFGSWLLQAWQSRKKGVPVVSQSFFALRSLASALLMFEGIRSNSLSITLLMGATLLLMLYNVVLLRKQQDKQPGV